MSFTSSEKRGLIALAAVMTALIAVTAWLTGRNRAPASLPTADTMVVATIDTARADTVTMSIRKCGNRRKKATRKRVAAPTVRRILNDTLER